MRHSIVSRIYIDWKIGLNTLHTYRYITTKHLEYTDVIYTYTVNNDVLMKQNLDYKKKKLTNSNRIRGQPENLSLA